MITVVSGLPRSGTSMMMQMVAAGGVEPMTDKLRTADDDNPRGYYELEAVKKTKEDASWLKDADGKVVKVISKLLYDLPPGHEYRIIFMIREIDEVLKSQTAMLKRMGKDNGPVSDATMRGFFEDHVRKLRAWLESQKHMKVLYAEYKAVVGNPFLEAARVAQFLERDLDTKAMTAAVDGTLYRNRS